MLHEFEGGSGPPEPEATRPPEGQELLHDAVGPAPGDAVGNARVAADAVAQIVAEHVGAFVAPDAAPALAGHGLLHDSDALDPLPTGSAAESSAPAAHAQQRLASSAFSRGCQCGAAPSSHCVDVRRGRPCADCPTVVAHRRVGWLCGGCEIFRCPACRAKLLPGALPAAATSQPSRRSPRGRRGLRLTSPSGAAPGAGPRALDQVVSSVQQGPPSFGIRRTPTCVR